MIRDTNLQKEEKHELTGILKKLGIIPSLNCQIVLHCAQGTVQAVEYANLKLK